MLGIDLDLSFRSVNNALHYKVCTLYSNISAVRCKEHLCTVCILNSIIFYIALCGNIALSAEYRPVDFQVSVNAHGAVEL